MDLRAEKIAKARQKLKDHQERRNNSVNKIEHGNKLTLENQETKNNYDFGSTENVLDAYQNNLDEQESSKETVIFDNNRTYKQNEVNVTEILISTKTTLEMQINKLTEKLTNLETLYRFESANHDKAKQKILALEHDLNTLTDKYKISLQEISVKDTTITELKDLVTNIKDENNNLMEQLEFTQSILTTKESENTQLQDEIWSYQNQLDVLQLQIQQLTNNFSTNPDQKNKTSDETDKLVKKISNLELTIEALQKERDQINSHYEHYVRELNEQIRSEMLKNEGHVNEIQSLYTRENSLIEQISDMEIRLQNYNVKKEEKALETETQIDINKKYQDVQAQLLETNAKYMDLQKQFMNSLAKIEELNQVNETECNHSNLSIDKLNADITSDKIAAQRATEQNKKLKYDVIELEQVIIKLGKDKLDLTELWTHEKQLNKGLTLKLAEVEESLRNMSKLLKAKDDEMIRLQNENRDLGQKYKNGSELPSLTQEKENIKDNNFDNTHHNNNTSLDQLTISQSTCLVEVTSSIANLDISNDNSIAKEDAMSKLQERFLNIMDQVANLSDEKHRLEHIILQLQNETETICEYVALYQQQRNLLKKREEERNNQIKFYEKECNKLKQHLEELQELLLRFAADPELETFFDEERRRRDLSRVRELLEQLHNCSFANPRFKNSDLNIFYPCRCCSGKVIDV